MREILSLVTGVQPSSATIDPETSVALGAAILSSIMDNQMMDMQVQQQNCSKCAGFFFFGSNTFEAPKLG